MITDVYNMDEIMEQAKTHLCKGVKKPRVRSLKKWDITNPVLMGVILVKYGTISEFAKAVGVHPRTASCWVYQNSFPSEKNLEAIEKALAVPANVLFWHVYESKK